MRPDSLGCYAVLGVLFGLPLAMFWWHHGETFLGKAMAVPMLVAFVIGLAFVFSRLMERLGVSGMSSEPLERELRSFLEGQQLRCPLYVTVAEQRTLYDPDRIHWERHEQEWYPNFPGDYLATYKRLHGPADEHISTLLASAALPFGVVPQVGRFVDGGTADNEPIYPLINMEKCEELVVIRLKPLPALAVRRPRVWWRRQWMRQFRKQVVSGIEDPETAVALYAATGQRVPDQPTPPFYRAVPLSRPTHWPQRIVTIAPSEPIGGFFLGTLNFTSRYARRQLRAGYQDALRVIRQTWPDARDPTRQN